VDGKNATDSDVIDINGLVIYLKEKLNALYRSITHFELFVIFDKQHFCKKFSCLSMNSSRGIDYECLDLRWYNNYCRSSYSRSNLF